MKREMRRGGSLAALLLAATMAVISARPALAAQVARQDTAAVQDTLEQEERRGVSPRGAMIRSFLLPGWGQAAAESYFRGGVFFSLQTSSWYMLLRTLARYDQATEIVDRLTRLATDSLAQLIASDTAAARRLSDPSNYAAALTEFPGMVRARALVNSRRQQRQDWITYTLFFTLISGVDAYVNAHLKDFPADITTEARRDGSVRLGLRLPLPRALGGTARPPASGAVPGRPPYRW